MKISILLRIGFVLILFNQCLAKSVDKSENLLNDRIKREDQKIDEEVDDKTDGDLTDIEDKQKSEEKDENVDTNEESAEESDEDDADTGSPEVSQDGVKLLIILVDGFRWDYPARVKKLKGLPRIATEGVRAQYVKPIFPANSYPNWYSIVTGLYGESHGMIENYMYDQSRDEFFLMDTHPDSYHKHWWNESEPIWITAQKNGIKTAMYLWDGCQVRIGGIKASICEKYRRIYDFEAAHNQTRVYIKQILEDFSADKYRLALLYHELVDHTGHEYGPRSAITRRAIREIDDILNDLYESIIDYELEDKLNVVIVSDHGMVSIEDFELILMEDILDFNDVHLYIGGGAGAQILPEDDKEEEVYNQLRQAQVKGLNVYRKDKIPERFHYKNNKKVLPIIITADEGYYIRAPTIKSKVYPDPWTGKLTGGTHGYDPDHVEEMRTIMYAFGPAFRKNYVSEPLEQVDHYNLFTHLLDMPSNPNNGTESKIQKLLKGSESEENFDESDEESEENDKNEDEDDEGDGDGDGVTINKLHSILTCYLILKFSVSLFKTLA